MVGTDFIGRKEGFDALTDVVDTMGTVRRESISRRDSYGLFPHHSSRRDSFGMGRRDSVPERKVSWTALLDSDVCFAEPADMFVGGLDTVQRERVSSWNQRQPVFSSDELKHMISLTQETVMETVQPDEAYGHGSSAFMRKSTDPMPLQQRRQSMEASLLDTSKTLSEECVMSSAATPMATPTHSTATTPVHSSPPSSPGSGTMQAEYHGICTSTGAVSTPVASKVRETRLFATDISPALERHLANAQKCIGNYTPLERIARLKRFREKRAQRKWGKRIKYLDRKIQAENQQRVRGRFAKVKKDEKLAVGAASVPLFDMSPLPLMQAQPMSIKAM